MNSPEQLRDWVLEALDDLKALEVAVLPVGKKSSIADYFVIASGTSETHCRAMAQEVHRKLKGLGVAPLNSGEGGSASWTLIDLGPVVVHVFSREARNRYNLEGHWKGFSVTPEGEVKREEDDEASESED
jgi:ribosome-associated protein